MSELQDHEAAESRGFAVAGPQAGPPLWPAAQQHCGHKLPRPPSSGTQSATVYELHFDMVEEHLHWRKVCVPGVWHCKQQPVAQVAECIVVEIVCSH